MYQAPQSAVCPVRPGGSPSPRHQAGPRRPTKAARHPTATVPPHRWRRASGPGARTCATRRHTA
eukprot:6945712-Lingulodinium_polyedra.AAC.1